MKFAKSALFAATMLSAVSASAVEVSGNVAIGSDYFFRGYDQSVGEALSGGFDISTESGLYVGVWGSTVDSYTSSGGIELDYYVGYAGSISETVSYDVGYITYGYPNDTSEPTYDFDEFYASVSYGDVTVGYAGSDDFYGPTSNSDYFYASYGMALTEEYSLSFQYGETHQDTGDWEDYAISLSTEAAGLGFDLSWLSSSEAGEEYYADNEFVLTISKSL